MLKSFLIKAASPVLPFIVLMPIACAGTGTTPQIQSPQALSDSKGDVILRDEAEQREDISRARTVVEALQLVDKFKLRWSQQLDQPGAIARSADRQQVEQVLQDLDALKKALEKLSQDFPIVKSTDRRSWPSSLRSQFYAATSARATKGTKP